MSTPIRVLIIEDSEDDAFLVRRELQRGGFDVFSQRVDTLPALRTALEQDTWSLIISDYNLPGFDGLHALRVFKSFGMDMPFLLISGAVGEEIAVDAMKAGAHDYIKKENLARLVPAVARELRETQVRKERLQVKEMLDASEARYRTLVENIPIGVYRCTAGMPGNILMANPSFLGLFGLETASELALTTMSDLFFNPQDLQLFSNRLLNQERITAEEWLFHRRDGTPIWGMVTAQVGQENPDAPLYFDCTIEDITSKKQGQNLQDAIYQIAQAMSITLTLEELIAQIHRIIASLMNATNFFLALLDEDTQYISFPYYVDEIDKDYEPIKVGNGLTSLVLRSGDSLLVAPENYQELIEQGKLTPVGIPPVDWLGVPLKNRENKTIGALVVQSYSERYRYTENDRNILTFVSSQVAISIERRQAEEALRHSEARQGALLNAIPDLMMVMNADGYISDFKAPIGISGMSKEQFLGKYIREVIPHAVANLMIAHARIVLESGRIEIFECEMAIPLVDGNLRSLEFRMSASAKEQVLTLIRDISEERQAEKRIEQQRTFLSQVIDMNPNFIFAKDRNGRFTLANQAVSENYGTTPEELIGKTDADFNPNQQEVDHFHKDDLEVIDSLHEKFIEEEPVTDAKGIVRRMQTVKMPLFVPGSDEVQVLGVSTDVTYAFQDSLTRLPNQRVFLDRLTRVISRSRRYSSTYSAVLILDLDRFALVNESFGQTLGDELLLQTAQRLQTCLRTVDTVARLGGDEFAILVEDLESVNSITQIAERIMEEISLPFELHSQRVMVSTSIGIVMCAPDYEPQNILRDADIALHRAKAAGKARYEFFEETMRENIRTSLQLETDLRQAINRDEFELHFEPIINIETGKAVSLEALLRWRSPGRGFLMPSRFIPLAEDTGVIIQIGAWVIREACTLMARWHQAYPSVCETSVSVNLSTKQFLQGNLVTVIKQILEETHFDPHYLQLEITESVIIENETQVIETLTDFRSMGIKVQMDDFGSGYSSLVYLHRLPLHAIKIDRSFISGSGSQITSPEIVRTIIHLANDLHLETIAEGVETPDQLNLLRGMGCNKVQGFLFSHTMPSDVAERFLSEQQGQFDWVGK